MKKRLTPGLMIMTIITMALALAISLSFVSPQTAFAVKLIPESQTVNAFALTGNTAGKVLIDIRNMEDVWETGIIEGSALINLQTLVTSLKLPAQKDAAIIVVSQDGSAGELAVLGLSKLGYTNVKNLEGGITAWKMMGFPVKPVERSDQAPMPKGC